MKVDPYYQRQNSSPMSLVSGDTVYKVYADTGGGSSGRGHQMTVWLSTTAVFGDLGSQFFGKSEIRPAILL